MQITNFQEKNYERAVLSETYHVVPFFSNGHLVRVKTNDNLLLHGFFNEPDEKTKRVFLYTHGAHSNFYSGNIIQYLESAVLSEGYAFLTVNNRGCDFRGWFEIIKDCLLDLDAWINFCQAKGFEEIVIAGSSLATHKILYYLSERENSCLSKIILISPSNNIMLWRDKVQNKAEYYLSYARELISKGQGKEYMPQAAYLKSISAQTFYDRFGPETVIDNFNFHDPQFDFKRIRGLKLPTLIISGAKDIYLPNVDTDLKKLEEINAYIKVVTVLDADHWFNDQEEVLRKVIKEFLVT